MLQIAIAQVNITPAPGLLMAGMIDPPKGQPGRWPLFGRVFMADDGRERVAIVSLDLLFLHYSTVLEMRRALADPGGLPPDNIMIACTHTHRAPYTTPVMDEPADWSYLDLVTERLKEAMTEAAHSLQPARLKAGHIQAAGWTFNRRPIYKGNQVGTQGPCYGPDFLGMEGPEDNEAIALLAEGEGGKPLGGLVNFACHTTVTGGLPYYSADYPGPLIEEMQARLGSSFMFLQGAAGNLWPADKRVDKPFTEWGDEHNERMGKALAAKAIEALAGAEPVVGERVRAEGKVLTIPQRQPTREQVELARWYLEKRQGEIDEMEFTRRIYDGHDYTFYGNSPRVQEWFCRETIAMWEWQRHQVVRQPSEEVEIQAIAIGDDLAFVGYPAEYFTEFGLESKAKSPFRHTIVAELANGWAGYVPTEAAFAHGGYECRLAYQSRLVPQAGDLMCRTGVGLLHMLKHI
ncbi:MAG: hypothetical protein ACUVWR_02555 [Anaerolineae bacterium]